MSRRNNGKVFDRRGFLERLGLGVGAGALSPLVPLLDREVSAQGHPKRFVVLWNGTGGCEDQWWLPTGPDGNLTLAHAMTPLQAYKDRLVVIYGNGSKLADALAQADPKAMGHNANTLCSLTGAKAGISVDQRIAQAIKGSSPVPVMNFCTAATGNPVSFTGPGQPEACLLDPRATFDKFFAKLPAAGGGGGPAPVDPAAKLLRERRRRILDYVAKDATRIRNLTGADGLAKVEAYRSGLEQTLVKLEALDTHVATATCGKPNITSFPANLDTKGAAYVPVGRLNQQLAAAALACDMTRVAVLMWGGGGGGGDVPGIIGGDNPYHNLGHFSYETSAQYVAQGNPMRKANLQKFYAEELATFLGMLNSYKEGAGTVLDSTLVLWVNGMGSGGHRHASPPIPTVLVVGKNITTIKPARLLKYGSGAGKAHSGGMENTHLLSSMCQAMGVPSSYGSPLPGLV